MVADSLGEPQAFIVERRPLGTELSIMDTGLEHSKSLFYSFLELCRMVWTGTTILCESLVGRGGRSLFWHLSPTAQGINKSAQLAQHNHAR